MEWFILGLKIAVDVVFSIPAALSTTVPRSCWTVAPRCRVRTTTAAAVTTARVSNTPRSLPRNTPVSCVQSPAARTACATPGAGSTPTAPSPRPPSSPCPARWGSVTYHHIAALSTASQDPILTAFKLSWELRELAFAECEFKSEYMVNFRNFCSESC